MLRSDENYDRILDRIIHLIVIKSNILDVCSHKYAKIKINSDDDLLLKKMTMSNRSILIKPYFNENHVHCYYKVLLETSLCK